ncbi:hypothetical protein H5410_046464 [Solanum commersonii]|uniref:Uncharacterized protein n=1 Tax=Solanum commersonii TaxID=4109 RepID=A0A9J5XFR4_SOLCO|nr:hypothetical protein H5410_046464 [Solanum commersonii]
MNRSEEDKLMYISIQSKGSNMCVQIGPYTVFVRKQEMIVTLHLSTTHLIPGHFTRGLFGKSPGNWNWCNY